MNEENSLLTGAARPALLRYALPIILSMVATQFYAVADTMIIGLRLDADALAAVSNASTVLMIFLFVSGGMELGGGLLVDDRLVAMSLAENCGGTLIIHVEKALYSHQGAYPTLVQAFAAHFGGDCVYINREDDAGDRGLRTSKLQYAPAKLAPKYHFLPQNELLRHVSAIPELKTERLTLSAITEADIPAYNALVLDSDRNRWWGYDDVGGLGAPVTERSFYAVARRDFENRMAVNFAVRLNGTLIGEAVLYNFDYRGSAELGCRIDKAYAGNGYGTEAFRCAAEWGLYQVNLSRIVAKCYKENEASYKMLSACMRRNGEDETFFYFEKLV